MNDDFVDYIEILESDKPGSSWWYRSLSDNHEVLHDSEPFGNETSCANSAYQYWKQLKGEVEVKIQYAGGLSSDFTGVFKRMLEQENEDV